MNVYDARGKPIRLGESVGAGGEATVYQLKEHPAVLAKIYQPAPRPNYAHKLSWMVSHPPSNPTGQLGHPSLAWPSELVFDSRHRLAGYLMPLIQGAVPILEVFNPRRRSATLPDFDRRYLHRAARNLAAILGALHRSGYVVGDLNESNVLVTPSALVTLIDVDSFQAQERRNGRLVNYPCPVGKFEYTPPELQGQSMENVLRLPEHDAFGLGVLIFQLLMDGNHPFRAQWLGGGEPPPIESRIAQGAFPYTDAPALPLRPPLHAPKLNNLDPDLVTLIQRCFLDGQRDPCARPTPVDWERTISEAEKALIYCGQGHIYSMHLPACPFCPPVSRATQTKPGRPSIPPAATRPVKAPTSPPPTTPRPATPSPLRTVSTPPSGASVGTWPNPSWAMIQKVLWSWLRTAPAVSPTGPPPTAQAPAPAPHLRPLSSSWFAASTPRSRILKSLQVGGSLGALAGLATGGAAGLISGSLGDVAAWSLLWALGGGAAGLLRGWRPGYRLAEWVNRIIGWSRFWQGLGLVVGAMIGTALGMIFWWAVIPIFAGLYIGAKLGLNAGEKIWIAGNRYGWERIWAILGASSAGLVGWTIAGWIGNSGLGALTNQWVGQLTTGLINQSVSLPLVSAAAGAIGGALGGLVSGVFADLLSRFSGLVD